MKKRRLNKKRTIIFFSIILFIGLLLFSGTKIIIYLIDNNINKDIKKSISSSIKITKDNDRDSYKVDFESLKEINEDVVAFVTVNNTNIDYVVVKATNNEYYLKHNFYKKVNVSGWVFADYRNIFDGTDKNIIIYGHNVQTGAMFGTLKNSLDKQWQEEKSNHIVTLVTEKGTYYYKVFSTYVTDIEDYYINTFFEDDDEYLEFLKVIKNRSNYDYKVDILEANPILTLSTCNYSGNKRVVLHAMLIK